ncbi:fumarylacetoacetate hydrolase family protein [Variovorax sp. KK3]|uniref:fumarylacetoacetate hydrolase family protein n=1 Tax=Variovorax sp. KK3 TaxID=1855728 RepID=UPI00097BD60B|nr:fumarylacetoacetate hydrolase family protein [Variovorax sp. KK3]
MKLVTYIEPGDAAHRLGSLQGERVIDLRRAYAASLADDPFAAEIAAVRIPGDMVRFLEGGTPSMQAAREACAHAQRGDVQQSLACRIVQAVDAVRLLAPVPRPRKIISAGGTYRSHVDEVHAQKVRLDVPDYPLAFLKMPSAVIGPDADIVRSRLTKELDYEIEIGLVIGTRCKDVPAHDWRAVVAGLTVTNDVSMRDIILAEQTHGIHFQGKNLDTCCPIGPCIATLDEVGDTGDLVMELRVNGEVRQRDTTRNMVHDFGAIVAYWSRVTLEPGDVITTGTTAGVAGFNRQRPAWLLKPGDVVEAEVQNVGVLRNRVVDEVLRDG